MTNITPDVKGMRHEFWLFQHGEWTDSLADDTDFLRNHPTRLLVDDSIVMYLNDTLKWVKTINPATKQQQDGYGLNLYGPTLIQRDGALTLASLLEGWIKIFEQGPEIFPLTGDWSYEIDNDGHKQAGAYEIIMIEKTQILAVLRQLASYAQKTFEGSYFIAHFGL